MNSLMTNRRTAAGLAAFSALTAWLSASKAALSRQLRSSVSLGDSPGVVALVVGPGGVLYQGAAGKLR